jgi:hypothetical protein
MLHVLSSKSKELGRDTCLFTSTNPCSGQLVLGTMTLGMLISVSASGLSSLPVASLPRRERRERQIFSQEGADVNQKLTPVSNAKIQSWIKIISPQTSDLFICPVTVKSVCIFEYCIQLNGPAFDETSDPRRLWPVLQSYDRVSHSFSQGSASRADSEI